MSVVGGIVCTSEVFPVASTAGLLAVTLLLSPFTTVTRVGGSLSLLWVNLGPSHGEWSRRCNGCVVSGPHITYVVIASKWVKRGRGSGRSSVGAESVKEDERKFTYL